MIVLCLIVGNYMVKLSWNKGQDPGVNECLNPIGLDSPYAVNAVRRTQCFVGDPALDAIQLLA